MKLDSAWINQSRMTGFGLLRVLVCRSCGHERQQIPLGYCANCGAKMVNAEEIENSEGKT